MRHLTLRADLVAERERLLSKHATHQRAQLVGYEAHEADLSQEDEIRRVQGLLERLLSPLHLGACHVT